MSIQEQLDNLRNQKHSKIEALIAYYIASTGKSLEDIELCIAEEFTETGIIQRYWLQSKQPQGEK